MWQARGEKANLFNSCDEWKVPFGDTYDVDSPQAFLCPSKDRNLFEVAASNICTKFDHGEDNGKTDELSSGHSSTFHGTRHSSHEQGV